MSPHALSGERAGQPLWIHSTVFYITVSSYISMYSYVCTHGALYSWMRSPARSPESAPGKTESAPEKRRARVDLYHHGTYGTVF